MRFTAPSDGAYEIALALNLLAPATISMLMQKLVDVVRDGQAEPQQEGDKMSNDSTRDPDGQDSTNFPGIANARDMVSSSSQAVLASVDDLNDLWGRNHGTYSPGRRCAGHRGFGLGDLLHVGDRPLAPAAWQSRSGHPGWAIFPIQEDEDSPSPFDVPLSRSYDTATTPVHRTEIQELGGAGIIPIDNYTAIPVNKGEACACVWLTCANSVVGWRLHRVGDSPGGDRSTCRRFGDDPQIQPAERRTAALTLQPVKSSAKAGGQESGGQEIRIPKGGDQKGGDQKGGDQEGGMAKKAALKKAVPKKAAPKKAVPKKVVPIAAG